MKNKYTANATKRFLQAMRDVTRRSRAGDGKVATIKDFAASIGHTPQYFNKYKHGQQVTTGIITAACLKYNLNPTWILLGEEEMYRVKKPKPDTMEAQIARIEKMLRKKI